MLKDRIEQYQKSFERTYGPRWSEFCGQIKAEVRPGVIQGDFTTQKGNPMSSPMYSMWAARAREVLAKNQEVG